MTCVNTPAVPDTVGMAMLEITIGTRPVLVKVVVAVVVEFTAPHDKPMAFTVSVTFSASAADMGVKSSESSSASAAPLFRAAAAAIEASVGRVEALFVHFEVDADNQLIQVHIK